MRGRIDIINSTLGKALGGAAGPSLALSEPILRRARPGPRPHPAPAPRPPPRPHPRPRPRPRPRPHPRPVPVLIRAVSTAGGYTSSTKELATILRQRSRPYLFSNALPPAVVAAASCALDKLMTSTELRDRLQANTVHFRRAMAQAGFKTKGVDHPIVPIMLGDARLASEFADEMLKRDIYVIGFSYPVVPVGTFAAANCCRWPHATPMRSSV